MTPRARLMPLLLLAACAGQPPKAQLVAISPAQTQGVGRASEGDYAAAKAAIARADYGGALSYLQAAAERDPQDARVPNAQGVVYDLMGRFDLSAKAYASAQALDPDLASVAQNIAYSHQLQAAAQAAPPPAGPAPAIEPLNAPRLVATDGATLRLELPQAPPVPPPALAKAGPAPPPPADLMAGRVQLAAVQPAPAPAPSASLAPGLTGHPLLVSNAGGRAGAEASVRDVLASHGWTAKIDTASAPLARSRIVYPAAFENVAKALARTLPGPAQLTPCQDGCNGLRLLLGADVAGWKLGAAAGARRS